MMFCQSTHKTLPRNRFVLMSGSAKSSFVAASKHVKLFRASHSELLVLVVSPNEQFLEAQELLVTVCTGILFLQKGVNSGLISDRLEAVNIVHGASLPACENVTNAEVFDGTLCTRGKLRRHVGHARILRRSRRVPSALWEQTFWPYQAHCLAPDLYEACGVVTPPERRLTRTRIRESSHNIPRSWNFIPLHSSKASQQ